MNCVSINIKTEETLIKISDNVEFKVIVEELSQKLVRLKKLYQDEKTPIRITGRDLKKIEIEELDQLIKKEIDVEVRFDMPKTLGLHSITKSYQKDVGVSETTFHRGSLRSGQKIEVEGSIVIIGDVNSGAEVVAGENIVVVGKLRGLAHAGAKGNKDAIISASVLDVVQIRISNIVKELEKDEDVHENAYIYVQEENIIIE